MSVHACVGASLDLSADFPATTFYGDSASLHSLPAEAGFYRSSPSSAGLLLWLQNSSARPGIDWLALEPLMLQLAYTLSSQVEPAAAHSTSLCARRDDGVSMVLESQRWWLRIGPIDPEQELIAIERDGYLVAALAAGSEGRLTLSVYRPLDACSLALITRLAGHRHPRLGIEMRSNNWELALDCAVGPESVAQGEGRATLGYWPRGLHGIIADDARMPLPLSCVAAQLLTFEGYLGGVMDIARELLAEARSSHS